MVRWEAGKMEGMRHVRLIFNIKIIIIVIIIGIKVTHPSQHQSQMRMMMRLDRYKVVWIPLSRLPRSFREVKVAATNPSHSRVQMEAV